MSKKNTETGTVLDENVKSNQSVKSTDKKVSLKEFNKTAAFSFNAQNYRLLLIGLAVNILGFILMIGGAAENPNEFNVNEIFGTVRITIAPIFIVAGYIIIMYAIMKKPKTKAE